MRRAGPVSRDLGTTVQHTKNQLRNYMEKSQPGQRGSRLDGLKIYHVIAIAGPAAGRVTQKSVCVTAPKSLF